MSVSRCAFILTPGAWMCMFLFHYYFMLGLRSYCPKVREFSYNLLTKLLQGERIEVCLVFRKDPSLLRLSETGRFGFLVILLGEGCAHVR